jgi:hypothetical protein
MFIVRKTESEQFGTKMAQNGTIRNKMEQFID